MTYQPIIDLASLAAAQGFRIDGRAAGDQSGTSVSGAGDINGDGFADIIVGAFGANPAGRADAGSSYIIFGKASGFTDIDLTSLSPSQGFRIDGAAAGDEAGRSVSGAGDFNGDGFADIIVGSSLAGPSGRSWAGSSYVILGKASGFADIDLANLAPGAGFRIDGASANDRSGVAVSDVGDVNGDGYDDVIVGAFWARNQAGSSYVVFGQASGLANIDLASLASSQGFRIDGARALDQSGVSVSSAGDINGDGYDDVILGAWNADPFETRQSFPAGFRNDAGSSYVVFGKASNFGTVWLGDSLVQGGPFLPILGAAAGSQTGISVSGAGDLNGDGFADIVMGAWQSSPTRSGVPQTFAGSSYVILGQAAGPIGIDLATVPLVDRSQDFRIDGAMGFDQLGVSVSEAGDVNGDGLGDIIVGAFGAGPSGRGFAGSSYVVFGKASGFSNIDLANLAPDQGFRIDGAAAGAQSGVDVSGAGDVNGDGLADLIVGAWQADPSGRGNAGSSYVVFGQSSGSITRSGGTGADRLRGYEYDDSLSGQGGADLVSGQGGNDTLSGGDDTDFIMGGTGADSMDGGAGFDSVSWRDANAAVTVNLVNQALNAGQAAGDRAFNFEAYYLSGFGDSFTNGSNGGYIFGLGGNDTLTGGSGSEFIDGGPGADSIDGGSGFDYASYASAAAGVRLDLASPTNSTGEAAGDTLANIEAFFLSGLGDVFVGQAGQNIVFGLGGADSLSGGANANDWLFGGEGNDTLTGGTLDDLLSGEGGADAYAFLSWVGNGVDSILTFTSGVDRIELTGSGFSLAAGPLSDGFNFISSATPTASGARPTLLYNTANGILSFDLDGTGSAFGLTPLAQFGGAPTLAASDFVVV